MNYYLKITEDIIVPNLVNVQKNFDISNKFQSMTSASFFGIADLESLVESLSNAEINSVQVLNENNNVITDFAVNGFESANKEFNRDTPDIINTIIRFA